MIGPSELFHKLKIRYKLLLILGVSTISLALGMAVVSRSMVQRFNRSLYENVATTLQLASRIVERELNDARNLIIDTATDRTLQSALETIDSGGSDYEREQEYQRIKTILRENALKDKSVPFIAFIGPGEDERLFTSASVPVELPGFVSREIERFTTKEYASKLILPPNSGEDFWVIINVRRISDYTLAPLGIIAATVDMNAITDLYTREPGTSDAILAIYSKGVKIFETRPSPSFNASLLEGTRQRGYWLSEAEESSFLAAYVKSKELDFDYVYFSPTLPIKEESRVILLLLLAVIVVLALLSAGESYWLAGYITRPLENLRDQLEEMVKGEFSPDTLDDRDYAGEDEIATFYRDFQIMASRIQHLLRENYQKTIENQEARLTALELQINPHFLYNTLDSIYWLSLSGRIDDVSTMTGSLSSLLRRTLEQDQALVRLDQELSQLEDYIAIQKIRFGGRLKWSQTVPESFSDYPVPPLILQPIVENSIFHALEPRKEGCSITLTAESEENLLVIKVEDDGPGMAKKKSGRKGIGLANIQKRLRIIYQEMASLEIYDVQPHGVGIIIRLPLEEVKP